MICSQPSRLPPAAGRPLFSVVTISFNQGEFLAQAIESVLSQGFPDFEYLILDGGSSDGSKEIIESYSDKLAYWRSAPDEGPSAALNEAVGRSQGRYLMYINSDDWLLPGALSTMANRITQHPAADVIYGNGYRFYEATNRLEPALSDRWGLRAFARGIVSIVQQSSATKLETIKRVGGFNTANRTCWDGELMLDIGLASGTFRRVQDFLGVFRLHGDSITGSQRFAEAYHRDLARMAQSVGINAPLQARFVRSPLKFLRDPLLMSKKLRFKLLETLGREPTCARIPKGHDCSA